MTSEQMCRYCGMNSKHPYATLTTEYGDLTHIYCSAGCWHMHLRWEATGKEMPPLPHPKNITKDCE